jgi:hypothetical protein
VTGETSRFPGGVDVRGEKFKISNVPAGIDSFIWFGSVMLFLVVGGAILGSIIPKGISVGAGFAVLVILAFTAPFLLYYALKTEVEFDGKFIRLKSLFKKWEIDLQKVEKAVYELETYPSRSGSQSIVLTFRYYGNTEGYNETEVLYDTVSREDLPKLVKGDHSDCPLLLLYDEIIGMYPEKCEVSEETDDFR